MAKRKKKKEAKKSFSHSSELYGILLVLAGILGIGRYGPVGSMIASFGIFLVGGLYNILLVLLIVFIYNENVRLLSVNYWCFSLDA